MKVIAKERKILQYVRGYAKSNDIKYDYKIQELALGIVREWGTICDKYKESSNRRVGSIIPEIDGTIKFHKDLVHPTKITDLTPYMRTCSHHYYVVKGTGLKNGYGVPTWYCIYCERKVISM